MLETYTQALVQALHAHPNWGFALAFFIAFLESLAVIGTIVPGSVTMTIIGALVGAHVMPGYWTFFVVVIGALCGDFLSYWFGYHYDTRLAKMWPFSTHPQWIKTGELFFQKHGGKSVIIGRFFGPIRSFVPLIAGFLHMNPVYFTIAVIPAAILWAIFYMTPGILLGALSTELPPGIATKFMLTILLALLGIWILIWLTRFIIRRLWVGFDIAVGKLWQAMRNNKSWHFITTPLADPREPNLHEQLLLLVVTIISFSLLLTVLWNITHHGILTALNKPLNALLQNSRTDIMDSVMTIFTLLGDRKCILGFSVAMLAWLSWQRYWRAAAHWLLLMVLVISSALAIKYGYYSPRPLPDLPSNSASSLPSGHTVFTMAFFGFLAVLISHELPRLQKKYCYKVALFLVLLAGFSRLYLGPHWLTDIVSSFLLGFVCVLIVTLSYRRHLTTHLAPKKLIIHSSIMLLVIWTSYSTIKYSSTLEYHSIHHTTVALTTENWWNKNDNPVPTLRDGRLGNPADPLNIQWHGSLISIKEHLEKKGWENHSSLLDFAGLLERESLQDPERRLPLLPQLFHQRAPVLLMTKRNKANQFDAVLYLWESDTALTNSQTPLWVGTLKKYEPHEERFSLSLTKIKPKTLSDVLPLLAENASPFKTTLIFLPDEKRSQLPQEWKWDGKILQLDENS